MVSSMYFVTGPGKPASASTHRPLSSTTSGSSKYANAWRALSRATASSVLPWGSMMGSSRRSSS